MLVRIALVNLALTLIDSEELSGSWPVARIENLALRADRKIVGTRLFKPAIAVEELLGCSKGRLMQLLRALDQTEALAELIV